MEIVSQICFYCDHEEVDKGIPLRKTRKAQRKKNGSKGKINLNNLYYIANGIDRVDSSKGYTKENCIPCCRPCNVAKLDRTQEEFINHAYRIVAKQEKLKSL